MYVWQFSVSERLQENILHYTFSKRNYIRQKLNILLKTIYATVIKSYTNKFIYKGIYNSFEFLSAMNRSTNNSF